ncbi:RluA family pseudouridine synthase [Patescibacteria group bacterium]|nr:RluA family pseudouridine synthase [Patescibacteria group bacterium]MBU1448782.1 RluA family pseudouridine synthase [Patescibacteria group bacterium]MBU2613526.1 RluA family pseudouridine synthase [Patescibacteria group bacterium]
MIHTYRIKPHETDSRLDVFLCEKLNGLTRSAIAKRLKAGAGTVNGDAASVHRFLKAGDTVVFDDAEVKAGVPHRAPMSKTGTTTVAPLRIVDETDGWVVINKPAGLIVHPDTITKTGTLVDALIAHDPGIAKVGDDPERPGIMHRLDREVGGLMVIAKTQDAFDGLKKQFAGHTVEKRYIALVHGTIAKDEGDIKFRIARSKTKARMAARPESEDGGKAAWTHFKILRRFRNATLLELAILSGRTHQIRAHMLALGHPVFGDTLYTSQGQKPTAKKFAVTRLLLQAVHLSFKDPATGEDRTYDLAPDPAFDVTITHLS